MVDHRSCICLVWHMKIKFVSHWIGQDESGPYRLSTLSNHDQLLWGFISIHYYIYPRTFWTGWHDIPSDEGVHCSSVCAKLATCNNHSIYSIYTICTEYIHTKIWLCIAVIIKTRIPNLFDYVGGPKGRGHLNINTLNVWRSHCLKTSEL